MSGPHYLLELWSHYMVQSQYLHLMIWRSDIKILKKEIGRDLTDTKYIIAPHNIENGAMEFVELYMNTILKMIAC